MSPILTVQKTAAVNQTVALPLIVAVTLLLAIFYSIGSTRDFMDRRDRIVLDEFHQSGRKAPAASEIIILGIDEASMTLDTLWPEDIEQSPSLKAMKGGWPWPRRVWAELIDKLMEAGAKVVFLDLTFKTPSVDPEDDRLLGEALKRHPGKVIIGAKFEEIFVGNVAQFNLVTPVESLLNSNAGRFGMLSFWPDSDDVVRRVDYDITRFEAEQRFSPGNAIADEKEPALPAVAKAVAATLRPEVLDGVNARERIRFGAVDYYPPLSLHQIFVPELWEGNLRGGAIFKDAVVYVGATATEMQDFQPTPVGRMAGVQLHGHALAALLSHSFITTTPDWWVWLSLAMGGFLAWLLVTLIKQPVVNLISTWLLSILLVGLCVWLFNHWSVEVSPVPIVLALNGAGMTGLMGNYWVQSRQTLRLRRSLVRYTSPAFVDELLKDREGLYHSLGGVERTVTVLFSDVRGFTSMSENMTPTEIVKQLNEYLSQMVTKVFDERGVVDKFIGDAVMALWGSLGARVQDDVSLREDALGAVRAALAMREALVELNIDWKTRGIPELKFGIGIHQGSAVSGNIGCEAPVEKMDITVIGDSVNLASRLEGITKEYGVDLVISEDVQRRVNDIFLCRRADLVKVKGKVRPVEVFTIAGKVGEEVAGLEIYQLAVGFYRTANFDEALAAFHSAATAGLNDELTKMYIERCEVLVKDAPETWDGVYTMTKK